MVTVLAYQKITTKPPTDKSCKILKGVWFLKKVRGSRNYYNFLFLDIEESFYGIVIDINNNTIKRLFNVQKKKVIVVPGAPHLFEEPDALEYLARLVSGWFRCYFLISQHGNHS